jgi:hypothetical protein
MNKVNSIAVLTCWYGSYPWYFPYFVHSCGYNSTVDFIIVTDNQQEILNKPNNLKIVYKTFQEVKSIASQKLGFAVNIDTAYKLCDYKPAYGLLFSELLQDYDFWGHGDIDIVYGRIRHFITDAILEQHDIINPRKENMAGTFCLYKNNKQMQTLFMKSRDYKKVFLEAKYLSFDECSFLDAEMRNGLSILDFPDRIQSMTYVVKKEEKDGNLRAYFENFFTQTISGTVLWEDGKITHNETEFMFYDLLIFKKICAKTQVLFPMPDAFCFEKKEIRGVGN